MHPASNNRGRGRGNNSSVLNYGGGGVGRGHRNRPSYDVRNRRYNGRPQNYHPPH